MRFIGMLCMLVGIIVVTGCGTVGHQSAGIDNFDRVSATLYRGAQPTEAGIQNLAAQHVKTVINLRDGDDAAEARQVRAAGMTYVHLPLDAEKVTAGDAQRFLDLLAKADGPVFVHCLVGRDRTGLAVAAYRIRVEGWTLQAATKELNDHGHFWLFFPKVREALGVLAQTPAAPVPLMDTEVKVASTPSPITVAHD